MKLKYILLAGVALSGLSACKDYLDVDAPSKYTNEYVYSQKDEIELALNGVYAQALVDNLYGKLYLGSFNLNSDVDIAISSNNAHSHNTYSRFDCDDQGGEIYKFWTAAYNLIEYANRFVACAEEYSIPKYGDDDVQLMQWIGEAKCLRAMAYHDLVVMFGDVPFTFVQAADRGDEFSISIASRDSIQRAIIADLMEASTHMLSTTASSVTVERCSKEFAQGLIARIALTAGGYSLHPDASNAKNYGTMKRPDNYKDYYRIAMNYADSVISMGTHNLTSQTYQQVFVNECNYQVVNNDDPIFEIPFGKVSTGYIGNLQGPAYSDYEGNTVGPWGKCSGSARLNAFYRFLFRDNDLRREFVNGLWYYSYFTKSDGTLADSVYIRNDYSVHNNKWSKLWTSESLALGTDKDGATGINYPYMRYADILLMYAEAANEINEGPTTKAIDCLTQVHSRAFVDGDAAFISDASASKEAFQKAVMDERKWEFAGENSRWRDLVRTNTYGEELVYSFLRYYSAGVQSISQTTGYEDDINTHDGKAYIDQLPGKIYYHAYRYSEKDSLDAHKAAYILASVRNTFYGCQIDKSAGFIQAYPNTSLQCLRIYNAYKTASQPTKSAITNYGLSATAWNNATFYEWGDDNSGTAKDQCKYSFYGYVRADDNGNLRLVDNGALVDLPAPGVELSAENLPVVRYILPYPNLVIQRSGGKYSNQYGY
ncbi:MAG: RagB/SusD family nutrient uptake outer membrane protein [Bacteroidales bacterium]|nr:RagB/SusD family nutrient uptake outer membrane protein [Bacteroidales bacterium]